MHVLLVATLMLSVALVTLSSTIVSRSGWMTELIP